MESRWQYPQIQARDVRVASRKERSLGGETAKLNPRPVRV
jgi:hypothetical protein